MWRFLMRCFFCVWISRRDDHWFLLYFISFLHSLLFFFRHKFNNFFCAPIEWENGEQEKIAVNNNEVKFILALSVLYAAFYNRIMILLIFIELLWQPLNLLVNSWSLFDFYEVKSDAILEFTTKTLEKV